MDIHRKILLIAGPLLLIGMCYFLTVGHDADAARPAAPSQLSVEVASPLRDDVRSRLRQACEATAQDWSHEFRDRGAILIRPPYVLAGDLSAELLDRLYRDVIRPTERALTVSFFDAVPTEPITIVAFAQEPAFRDFARRVDRRQSDSYYGYYLRPNRRIVVNISTGAGTLAHELTHALAHFDFPNMPEWFDEGLASLFEQSEFNDQNRRLLGADNWRVNHVLRALHDNQLRPTAELIEAGGLRSQRQAIDYAHARYVCLYLQEHQLLEPYYRKLRSRGDADTAGWQTLTELLAVRKPGDVDAEFRRWVVMFHKAQRSKTTRRDGNTLSMRPPIEDSGVAETETGRLSVATDADAAAR